MKNIHLVRTDNQSRIVIVYNDVDRNDFVLKLDTEVNDSYKECVNICITNLERPKVGDWSINLNSPYTHKELCKIDNQIELDEYVNKEGNDCQKVILTDDEDLIKDGVQAINDEFLEWFEKNPSCKEVEVGYGWIRLTETDNEGYWVSIPDKQFEMQQEEPKQETLEEVAKKIYGSDESKDVEYYAFINGAKWQQEQDKKRYSEEEVEKLIIDFLFSKGIGREVENVKEWFKQYKKK